MENFRQIPYQRPEIARTAVAFFVLAMLGAAIAAAQQPDASAVIRGVDAAVRARFEGIEQFTNIEHYAVYRGKDATRPIAEMTVKTLYRKDSGKSFTILSESGPEIVRKRAFESLLNSEKRLNEPARREATWLTSANYKMKLKPGGPERLNGRECLALSITPRQSKANLIVGTLWVDAKDHSIVQIAGKSSKSPSVWLGSTQMMRQYANMSGFAMATHARTESNSFFFGKIVVLVNYWDYQIQLRPTN